MESLKESKDKLLKQLEEARNQEKKLIEQLTATRNDISAVAGALQYHDYLVEKQILKEQTPVQLEVTEPVKTEQ